MELRPAVLEKRPDLFTVLHGLVEFLNGFEDDDPVDVFFRKEGNDVVSEAETDEDAGVSCPGRVPLKKPRSVPLRIAGRIEEDSLSAGLDLERTFPRFSPAIHTRMHSMGSRERITSREKSASLKLA